MTDWRDYLKPDEAESLKIMNDTQQAFSKARRRIYDRCRKRMGRAEG